MVHMFCLAWASNTNIYIYTDKNLIKCLTPILGSINSKMENCVWLQCEWSAWERQTGRKSCSKTRHLDLFKSQAVQSFYSTCLLHMLTCLLPLLPPIVRFTASWLPTGKIFASRGTLGRKSFWFLLCCFLSFSVWSVIGHSLQVSSSALLYTSPSPLRSCSLPGSFNQTGFSFQIPFLFLRLILSIKPSL